MDRRLTLANGRTAEAALEGRVQAERFVQPVRYRLTTNAWLLDQPDGRRDRQALFGDAVDVIDERDGQAFGRLAKDGYVGWLPIEALGSDVSPTRMVSVRTTWGWPEPDFKLPALCDLHMTSPVTVTAIEGDWAVVDGGAFFVPARHLMSLPTAHDPVEAAREFLGTPYVWAGNTGFGIDCSGLVQVAYHASGRACPPDSDLQEAGTGERLDLGSALMAGDLFFWKGHVALVTGPETLIHANAYHMAVVEEPIDEAIARIEKTGSGPVTSILRPSFPAVNL